MSMRKSVLALAIAVTMGSTAMAQGVNPVVVGLVNSMEAALKALPKNATTGQIQTTIATLLAMSTARIDEKEQALMAVKAAVLVESDKYPSNAGGDVQIAFDAILATGTYTAAGGIATSGLGLGTLGKNFTTGSSYRPG